MTRGEAFAVALAGTLAGLAVVGMTAAIFWPDIKARAGEAVADAVRAKIGNLGGLLK